jgi:hypothetical protein
VVGTLITPYEFPAGKVSDFAVYSTRKATIREAEVKYQLSANHEKERLGNSKNGSSQPICMRSVAVPAAESDAIQMADL